jgi:Sulfotransferase domain
LARTHRIADTLSTRELPLPTYLIIGAQKSATRWLRLNLGLHPDVYAASTEIQFFNDRKRFGELGVSWYRAQFEGWSGERFVGEATPGYMFWRHRPPVCAERIESVVPEVRLIALLRDPVDRAHSAVVHHIANGKLPKDVDILEHVRGIPPERDPLGIISGGWYAASLEPFRQRFGDQLLVVLHDDVNRDPRRLYEKALRHIGASPSFVPPELANVRFSYRDRPGFNPETKQPLTPQQRRELYAYFADDVEKLEQMLGRDLSRWDPGRSSG